MAEYGANFDGVCMPIAQSNSNGMFFWWIGLVKKSCLILQVQSTELYMNYSPPLFGEMYGSACTSERKISSAFN